MVRPLTKACESAFRDVPFVCYRYRGEEKDGGKARHFV